MIESQQPQWRNEEEPVELIEPIERYSKGEMAEANSKNQLASVELGETDVIAESVRQRQKPTLEKLDGRNETEKEISEKELEIRHEVQDDPSESHAVPLGDLIADLSNTPIFSNSKLDDSNKPSTKAVEIPTQPENEESESLAENASPRSVSYSLAVKIGFITALCFILAFIIIRMLQ